MPDATYLLAGVLVMGAVTFLLRLAPFVVVGPVRDSKLLRYLNRYMVAGIMVILVLYTLRDVDPRQPSELVPTVAGLVATVAAHLWRRNAIISLIVGTACYMAVAALF